MIWGAEQRRRRAFWFGNELALHSSMTIKIKQEEEWRELCDRVSVEADPQRLSELVDELIGALDARKQALRKDGERNYSSLTSDDT
jgi:hypothetical protein